MKKNIYKCNEQNIKHCNAIVMYSSFISYNSFHEYCLIFVCFVFIFSTYILDKIVNVLGRTDLQLDLEDF